MPHGHTVTQLTRAYVCRTEFGTIHAAQSSSRQIMHCRKCFGKSLGSKSISYRKVRETHVDDTLTQIFNARGCQVPPEAAYTRITRLLTKRRVEVIADIRCKEVYPNATGTLTVVGLTALSKNGQRACFGFTWLSKSSRIVEKGVGPTCT